MRAVSATVNLTPVADFYTDGTCELISPCNLSPSLYVEDWRVEGGRKFCPVVEKAYKSWFSKLNLPLVERQRYLDYASIQEWKKVKRVDSEAGDLMSASAQCRAGDSRDSSYVRVSSFYHHSLVL